MYAFKGFITHSFFTKNQADAVAEFGEISTQSLTYAKEKGQFADPAYPKLSYYSFLSKHDAAVYSVPTTVSAHILAISQFVYDSTTGAGGAIGSNELLALLIEEFSDVATNFACGPMVTDGNYYVPEWLSWKNLSVPTIAADNSIRVWYSDAAFREQYDEFEIVIVPPMDNLDDFFKTATEVAALLNAVTISQIATRLQVAKDQYPETVIRVQGYNYVDPFNAANKTMSNWGLLIYGIAGNNVDSISDKLVEFILANSTHSRAEWVVILPDLFRRTEFMIIPQWNKSAIENRQLTEGTYSPVVNITAKLAEIKQLVTNYPASHINAFLDVMGHPHKTLAVATIGGPENRDDLFRLIDVYPDLMTVASTSIDFNRMTQETQSFLLVLLELLLMAETMDKFTTMPPSSGMTKTYRNNKLYVVKNHMNINYMVFAKFNFE